MIIRSTLWGLLGCALLLAFSAPSFATCNSCGSCGGGTCGAGTTCPTCPAPCQTCPAPCPSTCCPAPCPAPCPSTCCPAPCPTCGSCSTCGTCQNRCCPGCPCACPPTQTIAQILSQDCNATQLVAALQQAGLMDCLNGCGPFTVFAPTNCAFCKLDCCTRNAWASDPQALKNVLLYHIAYGTLYGRDIAKLNSLGTIQGSPVCTWGRCGRL